MAGDTTTDAQHTSNEDDVEDAIMVPALQALDQLLSSPRRPNDSDQFTQRLRSFAVTSYYARPICLSSIICAASGWEIQPYPNLNPPTSPQVTTDSISVLTCSSCKAHLAMLIPRSLSMIGQRKILSHYQRQLWEAHATTCRYRDIACTIVSGSGPPTKPKNAAIRSPVIPTVLSRMFPSNSVALDLLERLDPRQLFKSQWLKLYPTILALNETLDTPDAKLLNEYGGEEAQASSNLLGELVQMMTTLSEELHADTVVVPRIETEPQVKAAAMTAAILLTGWDFSAGDTEEHQPAIRCSLCLSCQPLVRLTEDVIDDTDESAESGPRKRRKTRDSKWNRPVFAHRYFCPWVCGLPSSTDPLDNGPPLWNIMLDHMKRARTLVDANTVDDAVVDIHRLLKSGISSQRFEASRVTE